MHSKSKSDDKEARSFIERARRAQIVRAATDTIAEVGFAKASFARIAARAGISPGLISYHFAGKDELIQQVAGDITVEMDQALTERADGANSYQGTLRAIVSGFVHFVAEHPTQMYALREIAAGSGPAALPDPVTQLVDLLRAGQEHGEFREFSPRLMAVTLSAAMQAVPGELYSRPETDVRTYADELAETFVRAVRRGRRKRG